MTGMWSPNSNVSSALLLVQSKVSSLSAGGFTPRDSKNEKSAYKLSRLPRQVSAAGPERVSSEQRNVIGQITQV